MGSRVRIGWRVFVVLTLAMSLFGSVPAFAVNPAPYPYLPAGGSITLDVASGQTLSLTLSGDVGVLTVSGLDSVPQVTHVALYNMDYKPQGSIAGFRVTETAPLGSLVPQTPTVVEGSVTFSAGFTTQVYSTGVNEYFPNFPYGLYMLDLGLKDWPSSGAWTTKNNAYFYVGVDTTPPVITVPADVVLPADATGTAAYVPEVTATDNAPGPVAIACNPNGPTFPIGVTEVACTATDEAGNQAGASFYVVVYDPSGGFVTGGGWVDSLPGAYTADPTLAGKANFGFVSKYQKGKSAPAGETEFQFRLANLNFHSTSYDWLIVNQDGTNAQFKGSGTINGAGDFKFMLWAGDGAPDTFRIRIWEESNGTESVVYDTGFKLMPVWNGSIVIHKK